MFSLLPAMLPIRRALFYVAQMMGQGQTLSVDGVACLRGGRTLFEGLTFALEPGAVALITGGNGVGKSSLLRMIAGLLPVAAGSITVTGQYALADDQLALDPALPLSAALGFWARLDGGDVATSLEALGLAHLAPVPVHMLSTGQRKRATLARVLAAKASLWLLDEPLNGLDGDGQERLMGAISRHRDAGGAIVIASHISLDLDDVIAIPLGSAA